MESFAIVVLILGLIVASLARRHLREAKQLKLRQIIHQERMKAMEHNLSLPETDDPQLCKLFGGFGTAESKGSGWLSASVLWVRLVALCLGYSYINLGRRVVVRRLGCGCSPGFNANSFSAIVFSLLLLAAFLLLLCDARRLPTWKRRIPYVIGGVAVQMAITYWFMRANLWA